LHTRKHRKVYRILRLQKCFVQVGVTSTNGDLKGFIDQNQSPTKGKRILFVYVVKKHTLRHFSLMFTNQYYCWFYCIWLAQFWETQNLNVQNVFHTSILVDVLLLTCKCFWSSGFQRGKESVVKIIRV